MCCNKPVNTEITLNSCQEDTPKIIEVKQNYATKIPVYRQKIEEEEFKKPEKPYEFDEPDSDHNHPHRKRKRFEKTPKIDTPLHSIFQTSDINEGKLKAQSKSIKKIRQRKLKAPIKKYDDVIEGVMQKIIKKVVPESDITAVVNKVKEPETAENVITVGSKNECKVGNEVIETVSSDTNMDSDRIQTIFEKTDRKDKNYYINKNVIETSKENMSGQRNTSLVSLHCSDIVIDGSFCNADDTNLSEQEDDLDESFLEFGGNLAKDSDSKEIKISDKLKPQCKDNPWRFNQSVKRNPHFIILKNTALPCLKQDMVLDHDQVQKIEEFFSKTPKRIDPRKSPVQRSIREYLNGLDLHDKENIRRPSLFDYDDFSPIKCRTTQTNRSPGKAKRNILGSIQENTTNVPFTSTPTKLSSTQPFFREDNDIEDCLSFDNINSSTITNDKANTSEVMSFQVKRYEDKSLKRHSEEVRDLPLQQPDTDNSQVANESVNVQLFDEPGPTFSLTEPSKIYVKNPKRKRLKSMDENNEGGYLAKRYKKDIMTKDEEAALEEWAAKFNSMCQEVEKYDLEIE